MSLWQLDRVMYLPMIFIIAHFGLRGPKDFVAIARMILVAAIYKSLLAVYVMQNVKMPFAGRNGELPAALRDVAPRFDALRACDRAHRGIGALPRGSTSAPFGSHRSSYSGRRDDQQQPAHGVGPDRVCVPHPLLSTPVNAVKRKVKRYAHHPFAGDRGLFWWRGGARKRGSSSRCKQSARWSIPQSDASTMTREIENLRHHLHAQAYPVLGSGYGLPYWEVIPLAAARLSARAVLRRTTASWVSGLTPDFSALPP